MSPVVKWVRWALENGIVQRQTAGQFHGHLTMELSTEQPTRAGVLYERLLNSPAFMRWETEMLANQ